MQTSQLAYSLRIWRRGTVPFTKRLEIHHTFWMELAYWFTLLYCAITCTGKIYLFYTKLSKVYKVQSMLISSNVQSECSKCPLLAAMQAVSRASH